MKIIDPGHKYLTEGFDPFPHYSGENEIVFVKREGPGYPGNVGHHPGTIVQELLRISIDRIKYCDNQIHDGDNDIAIEDIRHALYMLEGRAARRHDGGLALSDEDYDNIENLPTGTNGHLLLGAGGIEEKAA